MTYHLHETQIPFGVMSRPWQEVIRCNASTQWLVAVDRHALTTAAKPYALSHCSLHVCCALCRLLDGTLQSADPARQLTSTRAFDHGAEWWRHRRDTDTRHGSTAIADQGSSNPPRFTSSPQFACRGRHQVTDSSPKPGKDREPAATMPSMHRSRLHDRSALGSSPDRGET